MAPSSMGRNGAQDVLLRERRSKRWRARVTVEPIRRAMTRIRASTSFKTRKASFIAQLGSAVWTNLDLNGWPHRCYLARRLLAIEITRLATQGFSEVYFRFLITERLKGVAPDASIDIFVNYLIDYGRWLEAERQREERPSFRQLATRRLHLVGYGRVGKNFPDPSLRYHADQQARASTLAKKVCRALSPHTTDLVPAFVIREALANRHRQRRGLHSDLDERSHDGGSDSHPGVASEPPRNNICHLLRLPAELRNAIYEYVLAHDADTNPNNEVNLLTAASPAPALPLTCKQIGEECGLMFLRNYRRFWRNNFYIDASSTLPTGWHVRPALKQLRERELSKIKDFRIVLTAKNGIYNAVKKFHYWHLTRVGGPDPSGQGALMSGLWGLDEVLMVYRFPFHVRTLQRPGPDFDLQVLHSMNYRWLHWHWYMIKTGRRGKVDLRGQICAIIEAIHQWT